MFVLFAISCARLSQQECNEKRRTPQTSRQPSLLPAQKEKRLVKNWGLGREKKIAPITPFFQAVLYIKQLKKTHVFISALSAVSCVPTGQPLQRLGFVLRQSIFWKKKCFGFVVLHVGVCARLCVLCMCAQHVVLAIWRGRMHRLRLLSPGTSWRHYTALMAVIWNMT